MDKNKVIQNAQKYIQKGQLDKAIREYEKILKADPNDVRTRLKIGDLQAKKGDARAAAEAYVQVSEAYAQQGFFLKAVAVYKQILKLDPERVEVNLKLAELYHQLGLMQDAMAQYQAVANYYERTGNTRASFDTLRRMLDLDPDNIASRIKLAEMYSKEGMTAEAIQEFRNAAAYLKERNRIDDYVKVCERLIFHDPGDIALTRELANIYLTKGDTKRALAKLQVCFKADPQDVETLHLLAKAFLDLGQSNKTISVYKELAKIYGDNGQIDEQRDAWNKVLELAPEDPEALAATGRAAPSAPAPGPPPGAGAVAARAPAASPAPAGGDADVGRLLTETDVYVKYGLKEKALEHLKKVFAIDPDNIPGHEKAKDLYREAGDLAAAGAELVRLIALTKETHPEQAREYLSEIMNVAPHLPEVQGFIAELGQPEVEQVSFLDAGPQVVDDGLIVSAGEEDEFLVAEDDDFGEEEDVGLEIDVGEVAAEDDLGFEAETGEDEAFVLDDSTEVDVGAEEDFLVDDFTAPVAAAPAPEQDFDLDDGAQATESISVADVPELVQARDAYEEAAVLDEFDEAAMRTSDGFEPVIEPQKTEIAKGGPEKTDEELAEELAEAEFFIQQGLPDEAREVLQSILEVRPDHEDAQKLLAQLDADEGGGDSEAPVSGVSLDDEVETFGGFEDFDLAEELADELADLDEDAATSPLDDLQVSADDVFSEFKKGVAATVSEEDADTHYDLGIAYREMGLTADAVGEFELAARQPSKRLDALSMIGNCQKELGNFEAAIEAFQQALADERASTETEKAIHYELAEIYEAQGEVDEARRSFERVVRLDPKFRDAKKRLAALGGSGKSRNGVQEAGADEPSPAEGAAGGGVASGSRKAGKVDYV